MTEEESLENRYSLRAMPLSTTSFNLLQTCFSLKDYSTLNIEYLTKTLNLNEEKK